MNERSLESLAKKLRKRRQEVFKEVTDTEADLRFIAEDRESEMEERAQEERLARLLARLDERGKREIEEIDAALERMARGAYGTCLGCEGKIPIARLRALPAARFCVHCAGQRERGNAAAAEEEEAEVPRSGPLPSELLHLREREVEEALRERVRIDSRIDGEELRIVCRHGVVHLDGALPSAGEHQILRKLVSDVIGMQEVVDRIQIKEVLWERDDRSREDPPDERSPWSEEGSTDDVVKSVEEGIDYEPPDGPTPEEE